jgi:hypothetical protein
MKQSTPWWAYVLVIALGIGAGFLLRPLIQGGGSGGTSSTDGPPAVRCPDPSGGELALNEYIDSSLTGQSVTVTRTYRLERPGLLPLQFDGGGDADQSPLSCANVRFGPGARMSFARGSEVQIVEYVGPAVKRFKLENDKTFSNLALDPKYQLALKLEDYRVAAPNVDEEGQRGRLELRRIKTSTEFPEKLVFTSADGGSSWVLDRGASGL